MMETLIKHKEHYYRMLKQLVEIQADYYSIEKTQHKYQALCDLQQDIMEKLENEEG